MKTKKIKDLTGRRFGRLVVIEFLKIDNHHAVWLCQCDCGNVKEVQSDYLVSNDTKSCGCLQRGDLLNKRFERLTVIREVGRDKRKNIIWECVCDCGNTTEVITSNLTKGKVRSCGCLSIELTKERFKNRTAGNFKPIGVSSKNNVYLSYKKQAKDRNLSFDLTKEQSHELFQGNCHYCGKEPSNVSKSYIGSGDYVYNGIDRVDNSLGYTIDNCVSCCKWCNRSKLDRTQEDFLEWINNVYKYRLGENNETNCLQ